MSIPLQVDYRDTHRLVPALYAEDNALDSLELASYTASHLRELSAATNGRLQAEQGRFPAIGAGEMLQGVPEYRIVNAAFAYAGSGNRFNDFQRGAWYAGVEIDTSLAEVAFHKRRFLRDARFTGQITLAYRDFVADFAGIFHDLEEGEKRACLQPEPVPECYTPGQALATALLYQGANGIVYSSVRNSGGTCVVCFRPALVGFPRRGREYRLMIDPGAAWTGAYAEISS